MDLEVLVTKFNEGEGSNPEALLEYAQQIQNFFAGSLDPSKLEYYLGLAFPRSKKDGLLGFLYRKITDRLHDKVKEAVFDVIHFVIVQKSWKSDAERFYIDFKVSADIYWKNSKETARLQQVALDCLIDLFHTFGTTLDLVEFEASQLYLDLLKRSEKSSYQPTVRGKMFHLMGILGFLGHQTFMCQSGWFQQLFNHVTSTVTSQVESSDSHLEVSILHGCIKGLDKLLSVFSSEINVFDAIWSKFQDQLQKIVDPQLSISKKGDSKAVIKRREFQRAALEIVANHSELLQPALFKKHRQWYEDLVIWAKSSNADDNRIGRRTMNTFLETIIVEYPNQLKKANADEKLRKELGSFFNFFMEKFKSVLNTKNANKIELTISVRGFGMLSNLASEQQVLEMLNLIMIHVNSIIHELDSTVVDKYSGSMSTLPTYLESVASILPALKVEQQQLNLEQHLESVKKLTILLIRFYPDMSDSQRRYAHISVLKVFDSLWSHHHLLCEPFIEQVYQQSLLHVVSCPTKAEVDILIESWNKSHPESKKSALSQLGLKPVMSYLRFWKQLLCSGQTGSHELRFDLLMQWMLATIGKLDLTIRFDDSETNLDPVQSATALVVKDFQIFVNMVDFYQELMSGETILHCKFGKWIVSFTNEILGYIKTNPLVSGFYKILSVVFDAARNIRYFEENTELEVCSLQAKLNVFFQGLGTKIQEFHDDLLFSVLELWLSLPDTLILNNFSALNQTLKTVFTTGRSSFPLALKGLDAVERWCYQKDFPVKEITTIMNTIYPILKTYFNASDGATAHEEDETEKDNLLKKRKLKELIKRNVQTSRAVEDPTLKATQLKIMQLIGAFGQFIEIEEKNHEGLSKEPRFLQYDIPFQDCKPELYIDDLLPRLLELCENAVERQTRISACEFFHTISLIFIGKSREMERGNLFRRIFHSVLKLGCDSDIVVRQLFNPLCLQMIHWFSKSRSPYGLALMDVLMENLTQYEDFNRRELAALCVGEYFQWSIKQQAFYDTDAKSASVLKSIFAMSTHASSSYRQGAVMAFNSIYRDFREDTNLTSEFSFNLLFSFLTSLKLSKEMPDDCLLITSTKQAIKHMERIFTKVKDRFNTALKRHFKPTVNTTETPRLCDVVYWLVSEGGNEAKVYREECLRLVEVLCPLTKDIATVERCLTIVEERNGIDGWTQIAEGSTIHEKEENDKSILTFLDASSAFYEFLYRHGLLRKSLFSKKSRSTFWNKLIALCTSSRPDPSTTCEKDKIQLLNIFARLKFAWEVLDDEHLGHLWSYSIHLTKTVTGLESLDTMGCLVKVWCSGSLSQPVKFKIGNILIFDPDENLSTARDEKISDLLKESIWHRDLAEGGFTSRVLDEEHIVIIRNKLWNTVSCALFTQSTQHSGCGVGWEANNLTKNARKLVENYLVTALCLGLDSEGVVEAIFDSSSVSYKDGTFQLVSTKGTIFQRKLLPAIVYCNNVFQFNILLQEKPIKDVGDFIQRLLNLIKMNRGLRKQFGESIYQQTLTNWRMISTNCDIATAVKIFSGLLAMNFDACKNSEELSRWWSKVIQARHLDLKQKTEVFGYVTVFATSRKKKTVEAIISTISYVVENIFNTDQNWADVEQYITYIFRKILKVFEHLPKSLELVTPILWATLKLSKWTQNSTALLRMARETVEQVVKSICETDSDRLSLVSHVYQIITTEGNNVKVFMESPSVWKSFLLPAVSVLNMSATKNFFKKHIYDVIKNMEVTASHASEWIGKTLAVNLLELLVYQTDTSFIKGKELADAYMRNATPAEITVLEGKSAEEKNKIVYRSIIKVCLNCLYGIINTEKNSKNDTSLRQFIFNFHEACYNTLVATLLVTKSEYKFFTQFLFRGKQLFEKLVDDTHVYEFPIFVDETSHKLGVVSGINNRARKSSDKNLQTEKSLNFLPTSGNLSGSSLAPEATSYDFTTSVTVANSEFYQQIFANTATSNAGSSITKKFDTPVENKLEWNEVNKHGCMFAYVETLKQLREFHRLKQDENSNTKSAWLTTLISVLTKSNHNSVKTFIVGGIINTPESMKPFAAELVEPIVQLILEDCFGRIKLNHFVQDVIITLLSWVDTPGAKPKDETVAKILKYFVEGLRNDEITKRKDVLNHVLEILQNVVKYWAVGQECVTLVPSKEMYALGPQNPTDENSSLRLHVCLSVLLGGQLPNPNVIELMKFLSKSTTSKYKGVYIPAAKCIGLVLRKVQREAEGFLGEHLSNVGTKLMTSSRTKPEVFVENLKAMQHFFPEIITHVKNSVMELFQFSKIRSELLSLLPLLLQQILVEGTTGDFSMNISPSSPNCVDDFLTDIESRGLFKSACKTDNDLRAAIDLFQILVDKCAQPSRLLKMIDWLSNAEVSSDSKIKAQFADCLTKLYERLLTEAVQTEKQVEYSTKQSFLKIFIRMYEDDRDDVRNAVNQFWTNVLGEWDQSADLMLELFDLIGQQEHPLNVFLGLILQRCSLAPDHSKPIFKEPLENCQFVPFELDTSWRLRHSTFQPLFAESLSSVQNFGTLPKAIQLSLFSQRRSVGKFGMNVLRATLANLQFTPTQQQDTVDTVEAMEIDDESYQVESPNTNSTRFDLSDSERSNIKDPLLEEDSSSLGSPILKLRKKFYAQKDSVFYATRESEKRSERLEEARDLQRSRVSGVKMVRAYRIGELPDIVIKHADVLNTLLKVAKQDNILGRQFLLLLFQGMMKEMQHDHKKHRKFLSKAKDIFDRVFRNTVTSPDHSLTTLVMELSIENSITLPTTLVLDMCKICNLQRLGILKLEGEVLDETISNHQSSKRTRSTFHGQEEEDVWLGLAELYKEIEEYDVLRNIFVNVERSTTFDNRKKLYNQIGNALHWEGLGHLLKAESLYDQVLSESSNDDISCTGKNFLEDSLMNCVAKLGDWDTLYTVTSKFNPTVIDDVFHNREIVERIIPLQMMTGMQLTLRDDDKAPDNLGEFHSFVENTLGTEEGTHFLTSVYPFDIGVWLLLKSEDEYGSQVNLMLERGYDFAIKQMKIVDSLPLKVQREIILSLQKSSILHDYWKWKKQGTTLSLLQGPAEKLLRRWSKFLMHQPSDLGGTNLLASYRDCFLSKIGLELQELECGDAVLMSIQEQRVDQDIWLANLSTIHKSFSISRNCLARLKESGREDIRPLEFRKSMAMSLAAFSKLLEDDDWCKRWCNIWRKLDKISGEDVSINSIKVDLLCCLSDSIRTSSLEEGSYGPVFKIFEANSWKTLATKLLDMSQCWIPTCAINASSSGDTVTLYNKLFCLLKKLTDILDDVSFDMAEKMLQCTLRGCSEQGNANEMLQLPNIFPLLKQFPNLNQTFELSISSVPSYLFLPWIDQIVTAYKCFPQEYICFKGLLNRLVQDFPQAFQLQYPEYLDSTYQLFGTALKALVLPFKMHEDMIGNILFEKNYGKRISLLTQFQETLQNIINNFNTLYGEYHIEYAQELFEIVNRVLSDEQKSSQSSDSLGSQHEDSSQSWNTAKLEIQKVCSTHTKKGQRQRYISLEKLSPFLANFHFFEHLPFEKPGLYENFRKPNIQENPLVVSFHPTVQYFSSMTRPIKVTVITNDGKRSHFLSKLGDDLRQDRRIQQLFKMSNVLFQSDVTLKQRNFCLSTYACIPITHDFGLIEMIDNVMSLVEVLFDTPDLQNKRGEAIKKYERWLRSNCDGAQSSGQNYEHYRISARKVKRDQAESFYTQLVESFPKNMLRDNIKKRSSNMYEYFSIRQSMVRCYGAMSMVHWLLGIGDRHLENCLLSMSTGNIVGIDFGRAFGTSNYIIPVPEMIPFRLTPQLQQIMMPYSYNGIFRESCIRTWNCLVDASDTILTVANVFIQEPTVDWLKFRQGSKARQEKEQEQGELALLTASTPEYFPFEIMKKKLLGHNPTNLILDELKMHNRKDVPLIYCRIVEDGRLFMDKQLVSSEEYVDILLNLATDKNVLSRIFSGWNPWV